MSTSGGEPAGYLASVVGSRPLTTHYEVEEESHAMEATATETGQVTGTKDKDYNIIWFTEQCLSNALRLETYIQDAERENDSDLADFFRKAQHESQKGAEQGKELLKSRL
jgi:hypothetical protein